MADGHRWESATTPTGAVLVCCRRCREIVTGAFVDEPVLGASPGSPHPFGDVVSCRRVLDLLLAADAGDATSYGRIRAEAAAQPGRSVDALASLALGLARVGGVSARATLATTSVLLDLAVVEAELKAAAE